MADDVKGKTSASGVVLHDAALLGQSSTWLEQSVLGEMEDEDEESISASGVADADTMRDTALMGCPATWSELNIVNEMVDENKEDTSTFGIVLRDTALPGHPLT